MTTTAKNLTTAQIRSLRREALDAGDLMQAAICDVALDPETDRDYSGGLDAASCRRLRDMTQDEAVTLVVEALNAAEAQA